MSLRASIVMACSIAASAFLATPVRADPVEVERVLITDRGELGGVSMVLTFDEPIEIADIVPDPEPIIADNAGEVSGDSLTFQVDSESVVAMPLTPSRVDAGPRWRGGYGDNHIACNTGYQFSDLNGSFGVQRRCGVHKAPWYFVIADYWRRHAASMVSEDGLKWSRNRSPQPDMAEHFVPATYVFHGTFNPVGRGDTVSWQDFLYWRHDIGSGGEIELHIWGALDFKGRRGSIGS